MNSLYQEQLGVSEDDILDNYVALLRHAIKDKRMFVRNKCHPYKPPEMKDFWKKELRVCEECKIVEFYPRYYGQKFCGSEKLREGCAYQRRIESIRNERIKRIGSKYKNVLT